MVTKKELLEAWGKTIEHFGYNPTREKEVGDALYYLFNSLPDDLHNHLDPFNHTCDGLSHSQSLETSNKIGETPKKPEWEKRFDDKVSSGSFLLASVPYFNIYDPEKVKDFIREEFNGLATELRVYETSRESGKELNDKINAALKKRGCL